MGSAGGQIGSQLGGDAAVKCRSSYTVISKRGYEVTALQMGGVERSRGV